ncbi:MAG: exosome complex exonuclease Rrp41 [Candidatus Heimdallarchaeota archaeon]|nr:exosome complex exonuclease Rrp41 [Candidatus Heimdallarchaeota archaeon]
MKERLDGRAVNELRKLKVELGVLERADGSARVELGKNIAIASVFGPRELHPKHRSRSEGAVVRVTYRMATFSVTDYKRSFPSRREKEISKVLSEAFQSNVLTKFYPRSAIDVNVQIFESDGGTRTAAAIAASAALADAGVPMRDLVGGIASGIIDDEVVLDLTGYEDMKGTGDMPILYSPSIDEVGLFQLDGLFTLEQFKQAYSYSLKAIEGIVDIIKNALKSKYLSIKEEIMADDEVADEEDIDAAQKEDVRFDDALEIETSTTEMSTPAKPSEVSPPAKPSEVSAPAKPSEITRSVLEETTVTHEVTPVVSSDESTEESSWQPKIPNLDDDESATKSEGAVEKDEKEEHDPDWYDQSPNELKPMGGSKTQTSEDDEDKNKDILRDIEYLEEDE